MPQPRCAAATLLCAMVLASPAAQARAAPADGDQRGRAAQASDRDSRGRGSARGGDGAAGLVAGGDEHSLGQVNPLQVENPLCDKRLGRAEQRNCQVTGTPEGRYPTSNYGFEIHIDTGVDNIVGNFQSLLAHIADAIWMALLFVLSLVLTLLGWAFELSPFTDNRAMAEIGRGLERFYRAFTSPWLVFAFVAVGAWAVWRGLARRQFAQAIGGSLLTVALMVGALVILHEPRATVGTVAGFTNDASQAVIAAPQSGSVSNPSSSYAEATARTWSAMTLPGFAALNFSDMGWALSRPDPELLAKANERACRDYAYLRAIPRAALRRLLAGGGEVDCGEVAAAVPAPRTNAEIWLRNSPGSEARDSLWDAFTDDFPYSSYLAIQGDGGAWTRLPLVLLIGLGLLGGIALLAWLSIRIFVQTAVAFVLVLSTPLALFMPAFGERGRAAFAFWAGTLAGALVSKLVYAALLAVTLFATNVVASLVPAGAGAFMGFLVMAGLWWAVFLKRDDLLSFLSVAPDGEGGSGRLGTLTGLYATQQLGRRVMAPLGYGARGARAAGAGARGGFTGIARDRSDATGKVASGQLARQAEQRLAARYRAEKGILGEQAERRAQLARLAAGRSDALKEARRHGRLASAARGPERERHEAARRSAEERAERLRAAHAEAKERIVQAGPREGEARAFVSQADERQRSSGARFSGEQLGRAREAIRREVDRPVHSGAHAWRVGMSPQRYESLTGREREHAQRQVAEQLRSDRLAFGAIPNRPAGLVGGPDRRRYRRHVRGRERGASDLREARLRARRARRQPPRRGVSR
jgi:hypothetical protein